MSAGEPRPRRSGRRLRDDERQLWKVVTTSIAPLSKRRKVDAEVDDEPAMLAPIKAKSKSASKAAAKPAIKPAPNARLIGSAAVPAKPVSPVEAAPLGRKAKRRLSRGTDAIDARLDLHGRTQAEAHDALLGFLHWAQARGDRVVLVITGKGRAEFDGERGVLKRQVPMWLRLPEFRACVVGFESAGIGHGGEGALYVRLRRAR
jgi:DNA-nicking Smr family endonuclease